MSDNYIFSLAPDAEFLFFDTSTRKKDAIQFLSESLARLEESRSLRDRQAVLKEVFEGMQWFCDTSLDRASVYIQTGFALPQGHGRDIMLRAFLHTIPSLEASYDLTACLLVACAASPGSNLEREGIDGFREAAAALPLSEQITLHDTIVTILAQQEARGHNKKLAAFSQMRLDALVLGLGYQSPAVNTTLASGPV